MWTDYYELTMAQGYYMYDRECDAVFEMFFRSQPFGGGYAVFAGLETLAETLLNLKFSAADISFLEKQGVFKKEFLDRYQSHEHRRE